MPEREQLLDEQSLRSLERDRQRRPETCERPTQPLQAGAVVRGAKLEATLTRPVDHAASASAREFGYGGDPSRLFPPCSHGRRVGKFGTIERRGIAAGTRRVADVVLESLVTSISKGLHLPGIAAKSDTIYELVEESSAVEMVATGFTFTEGPVWHPTEHHLLFSDMPADIRRRYTLDGTVTEVMNPSNKCNGMTYDGDLNRLVCEHVTSCLVCERSDGTREIVASHFEGQELNSPNDVIVRSDGSIYFSDPWYGRMPVVGLERKRELGFQGVYRIAPGGGEPELVVGREDYEQPNGLCFSPDESLLYVNDTPGAFIDVYDVNVDGSLSNRNSFFKGIGTGVIAEGIPDGMKCDERGNVWVTGPGGIWVISAAGEHLGVIEVPENTGNLTWGGADWHTLFIPASTSMYAIRTSVGPRYEPYMRQTP